LQDHFVSRHEYSRAMRRVVATTASLFSLAACQSMKLAPAPAPLIAQRMPAVSATFSKPEVSDRKGPPSETWIFASNGEAGNVDVYSAKTFRMISECSCTGVGLAVDPRSGDLAVGTRSGTVTVWHVKSEQITLFATLNLSQGPYAIGLAFDKKGNLYAANASDNVIDFFKSSKIEGGGGGPTRTLFTSNLNEAEYLAADAHNLLADGYNSNGQPILVSINTRTGADTILQAIVSGNVPEGIVFDRQENLILNTTGNNNTLAVFKRPWSGSPTSTFVYGDGAENGYYTGISLNRSQNTLWAASFSLPDPSHGFGSVQANSYPLGSVGRSTTGIESEFYDSIAADPQAK
jgi:DNA-binding beta-propeller fold protein YncE